MKGEAEGQGGLGAYLTAQDAYGQEVRERAKQTAAQGASPRLLWVSA
jgi:hypothetical protein